MGWKKIMLSNHNDDRGKISRVSNTQDIEITKFHVTKIQKIVGSIYSISNKLAPLLKVAMKEMFVINKKGRKLMLIMSFCHDNRVANCNGSNKSQHFIVLSGYSFSKA